MCSTCGAKTYGQEQPEARQADLDRLAKVNASMENKNKATKE